MTEAGTKKEVAPTLCCPYSWDQGSLWNETGLVLGVPSVRCQMHRQGSLV